MDIRRVKNLAPAPAVPMGSQPNLGVISGKIGPNPGTITQWEQASGTSSSPCCPASGCWYPIWSQTWQQTTMETRYRGRPRNSWIRQVEVDSGLSADAAWDTAGDRCRWRAQRPPLVTRTWWWWWWGRPKHWRVKGGTRRPVWWTVKRAQDG